MMTSSDLPAFEAHPMDVAPGYPREYERRLRLPDGRVVQVRPIIPDDQARLSQAFQTADIETLYRRFLGNPPHLTAERLTHWCTVDYQSRFALVACAVATAESVAVARYEPMDDGVAEVAVAVDPRWRRMGVATAMVEMLAQAALERGIHSFGISYLAGNQPVAALAGLAGARNPTVGRGVAQVAVHLDRERVTAAIHAGAAEVAPATPPSSALNARSPEEVAGIGAMEAQAPITTGTDLQDDVLDGSIECVCLTPASGPTHVMLAGVASQKSVDVLRDALAMASSVRPHQPVVLDLNGLESVPSDALDEIDRIVVEAVRGGTDLVRKDQIRTRPRRSAGNCDIGENAAKTRSARWPARSTRPRRSRLRWQHPQP